MNLNAGAPPPRAILVGLNTPARAHSFASSMEELAGLAKAIGLEPLLQISQQRPRPENATYLGRGKLEELKHLAAEFNPDIILFDHELSGSQLRNLEAELNAPVMDRSTLILEIFQQRARSREGQLQVELARLEYSLPRLTGQGRALSRIGGGGLATRGAGEQKLETDRRRIRQRIDDLKQQLKQQQQVRATQKKRRHRSGIPTIALAGYTNAGKSSLFNALCQRWHRSGREQAAADDRLFQTLDTTTRRLTLPSGRDVLLSDSVGFIQNLPHHLVAAFRATLEEAAEADLLLHVADSSDPRCPEKLELVEELLLKLGAERERILTVFNKIDLLPDQALPGRALGVSALTGDGLAELALSIEDHLR